MLFACDYYYYNMIKKEGKEKSRDFRIHLCTRVYCIVDFLLSRMLAYVFPVGKGIIVLYSMVHMQ